MEQFLLLFYFAGIQFRNERIESIEKTKCRNYFQLESIIREKIHKREKAKVGSESKPATRTSRYDGTNCSSYQTKPRFFIEILMFSKFESTVKEYEDKEWKAQNHNNRKKNISIGMDETIIPEHDGNIGICPPQNPWKCYQEYICESLRFAEEKFFEVLKHYFLGWELFVVGSSFVRMREVFTYSIPQVGDRCKKFASFVRTTACRILFIIVFFSASRDHRGVTSDDIIFTHTSPIPDKELVLTFHYHIVWIGDGFTIEDKVKLICIWCRIHLPIVVDEISASKIP